MQNYVAIPKERFIRLTRHVLNKTIVDSKGSKIGKIDDVIISNLNDYPVIDGIISNKKFILWEDISALSEYAILNKRFFNLGTQNLDASKILLSKQILDEQLMNEKGCNIGRVDDLAMMYSNIEKKLNVLGICTGMHLRMGIQKYYDIIPWTCVKGFNERPSALIINTSKMQHLSYTSKVSVCAVRN